MIPRLPLLFCGSGMSVKQIKNLDTWWGKKCWKLRIDISILQIYHWSKNQIRDSFPRILSFKFTKYVHIYCKLFLRNKVIAICFTIALKINLSIDIFMAYADVVWLFSIFSTFSGQLLSVILLLTFNNMQKRQKHVFVSSYAHIFYKNIV